VKHSVADITLSREVLGFVPTVTLPEGISKCRNHYASTGSQGIARGEVRS
jgi:nucleoside-diphosphate-sugar epimerase